MFLAHAWATSCPSITERLASITYPVTTVVGLASRCIHRELQKVSLPQSAVQWTDPAASHLDLRCSPARRAYLVRLVDERVLDDDLAFLNLTYVASHLGVDGFGCFGNLIGGFQLGIVKLLLPRHELLIDRTKLDLLLGCDCAEI